MTPSYSQFATNIRPETAFVVLARAKALKTGGKDIIELEIGDSPFETPKQAVSAGIKAIQEGNTHYGPSVGLPEFRRAASCYVNREHGLTTTEDNIIAGPGAKTFEQLFCEAFINPEDGVLVFSPHFPTYGPNIARRGGRMCLSTLKVERSFRPNMDDVEDFINNDSNPKAIFLNSPHNPTGGVVHEEDLVRLADLIRGRDIVVFSDEPYDCMVWNGRHQTLLSQPGMLEHTVAAYTFSKSYSMSGWRLGFAVADSKTVALVDVLTITSFSCVPPFTQLAGVAVLEVDQALRDEQMANFRCKVELLVAGLNKIEGVSCLMPGGTFYVFPSVKKICQRFGITSHGLALYLLEAADDQLGIACLGGECFGKAGTGFLRLSCAETTERLNQALLFMSEAFGRIDRIEDYLAGHPEHKLQNKTL